MANERACGALDGIGDRDHSRTCEYRIFGPPGTGKTTSTADHVRRAASRFGADRVLVTSFSRAAAAELAAHDLPIGPEQVGTLHSLCYRALGRPEIAETHVEEWNAANPNLPITPVNRGRRLGGEDAVEDIDDHVNRGDVMLQRLNRLRGLMIVRECWPSDVSDFDQMWSTYKRKRRLKDFCDLIDVCYRDGVVAPGRPAVIFADEAQDLNVMQLKLIRAWGTETEYLVLALDDDQTIYPFTGALPEAALDPDIPEDHQVVLEQSHRLPRAVHRLSDDLVRRLTRRQEKFYRPRPDPGAVRHISGNYKSPEYAILSSATKHLEQGKRVMFITSCAYMLRPLIQVLRKNAIPFHNPYRRSNGHWNPIRLGTGSSARRILALTVAHPDLGEHRRVWTHEDVLLWAEWLRTKGILKTHAIQEIRLSDPKRTFPMERLSEVLEPAAVCSFLAAYERGSRVLIDWWRARVQAEVGTRIQYPADIAQTRGSGALVGEPGIVVGTIHSVKGGEADVVYLFPDLSAAGDAQYQLGGSARDSVIRLFYVGATRARETLYICERATSRAIAIEGLA